LTVLLSPLYNLKSDPSLHQYISRNLNIYGSNFMDGELPGKLYKV
jgi:hypothetical protein